MIIHQFYDKGLAHASYAVIRDNKMVVIDPSRDPQPYYDFAILHEADIVGVIETHPHADFVSSHLEIHQTTGATIYCSKLVGALYPHQCFDDGDVIYLADAKLNAINTPGHSPDSICILLQDEDGKDTALFTGDTLFVGDVGRPDLREDAGNITAKKEELAAQLFHSLRDKLMHLPEHITVYPAHGPALCGKTTSPDLYSTLGRELKENYMLQIADKNEFINMLLADQPFVPHYFGFDVDMNKKGAPALRQRVESVQINGVNDIQKGILVIDTRNKEAFRKGHLQNAINLQDAEKFETWLGSVVEPYESFYLLADSHDALETVIKKAAKIGYEQNIKAGIILDEGDDIRSDNFDLSDFKTNPDKYTIVDVRNRGEVSAGKIFADALTIPLPELRKRLHEIPTGKPIIVHCAAGYRSAAASSIIAIKISSIPVYDLSDEITQFSK